MDAVALHRTMEVNTASSKLLMFLHHTLWDASSLDDASTKWCFRLYNMQAAYYTVYIAPSRSPFYPYAQATEQERL